MMFWSDKIVLLSKITNIENINNDPNNVKITFSPLLENTGEIYGILLRKLLFNISTSYKIKGYRIHKGNMDINIYNKIDGLYEIFLFIIENFKKVHFKQLINKYKNNIIATIKIDQNKTYKAKDIIFNKENTEIISVENPEQELFTISDYTKCFKQIDLLIDINEGYKTKHDNSTDIVQDFRFIDTLFSPILQVSFEVNKILLQNRQTDSLILHIKTDGSKNSFDLVKRVIEVLYTNLKTLFLFNNDEQKLNILMSTSKYTDNKKTFIEKKQESFEVKTLNDISTRLKNCLLKLKINNILEICNKWTQSEIQKTKDLGKKSFEELLLFMQKHNLHFKK